MYVVLMSVRFDISDVYRVVTSNICKYINI